jgi:eukaryotic-like serine/threonine-protein kinase
MPESPRKLNARVPRDLDVVCLKCLEKDPQRRYASADALAQDLNRLLAGMPIAARPVGSTARLWMWCRRNPVAAGAAGLVATSLVVVAVISLLYAGQQKRMAEAKSLYAEEQKRHAEERGRYASKQAELAATNDRLAKSLAKESDKLERSLIDSNRRLAITFFERAQRFLDSGEVDVGLLWLVETWRYATRADDRDWQRLARANLSFWRAQCQMPKYIFFHTEAVWGTAFSPDGKTLLSWTSDGTAWLWDCGTGLPRGAPLAHEDRVHSVAFSPDGETVLTAGGSEVRFWEVANGDLVDKLPHRLFTSYRIPPASRRVAPAFDLILSAAFSPDGKNVLTGGMRNGAQRWDVAKLREIGERLLHRAPIHTVAFSPDGKTMLTVASNVARIWDAATHEPVGQPLKHQDAISAAAYAPDGKTVLTGSYDGIARLWDVTKAEPIGLPMAHEGRVRSVAFSPDGQTVLTGSADKTARLWDVTTTQVVGQPMTHRGDVTSVAFSPDGNTVVTASADKTARLWDSATTQQLGRPMTHRGEVTSVAFSPDGKTVLTGSSDKTARLWQADRGRPVGRPIDHQGDSVTVIFSPNGRAVLTVGGPTLRLWDAFTGRPIGVPIVDRAAFGSVAISPDGKTILTGSKNNLANRWDAATSQPIAQPLVHQAPVSFVGFSPDGKTAVTGSDQTARLWGVASGKPIGKPMAHPKLSRFTHIPQRSGWAPIGQFSPCSAPTAEQFSRWASTRPHGSGTRPQACPSVSQWRIQVHSFSRVSALTVRLYSPVARVSIGAGMLPPVSPSVSHRRISPRSIPRCSSMTREHFSVLEIRCSVGTSRPVPQSASQ